MASLVTSDHELKAVNNMIDSAFVESLMEELHDHVEVSDEERLKSVIQSLEAEINPSKVADLDHGSMYMMELEPDDHDRSVTNNGEYRQSCSLGQTDDQDCSVSFDDHDMNGMIDMEAVPCLPSHHLNWHMCPCGDEIFSNDCSVHTYNPGVALDLGYGYDSLWQATRTYDSVMYE